MTPREELLRKALLHDQAAELLRMDAERHESDAKQLREEAALLEDPDNEHLHPWPQIQAAL